MLRPALPLLLAALLATSATAHENHAQPRWGGVVADAGTFQAELVIRNGQVKVYLSDHAERLPAMGASARLTLLAGGRKEELDLKPAPDGALGAATTVQPAPGIKAVAVINVPGKGSGNVRFVLK